MKFMDFFTSSITYPDITATSIVYDNENEDGGILFEYIGYTFLLTYINAVKLISGYGVHRYTKVSEKDINKIYGEYFTNLSNYDDDCVFLGKSKSSDIYYFFYFDGDVSDCMIGTFKTSKSKNEVISLFDDWVKDYNDNSIKWREEFATESVKNTKPLPIEVHKVQKTVIQF